MKNKIFDLLSIVLNMMSALFILIFAIVSKASVVTNVFACIAIATVCIDLLKGVFLKGVLGIVRISATLLWLFDQKPQMKRLPCTKRWATTVVSASKFALQDTVQTVG